MTWNAPDEHQHQLTINMSIKSKRYCTKIVDWQLETLLTLLAFQEDHSTPFQKIFWEDNSWFLHHDNAPSHNALVLCDHFAKNSTHIVPKPPYSPDLAPCDFWLFPKLKRPLRGHRFDTIEEIQAESKKALKATKALNPRCCCFWSAVSKRGTHFENNLRIPNDSCKIVNTLPSDIFKVSAISCNFNLRSLKTILWTFVIFSGTTSDFGRPERSASSVFVRLMIVDFPRAESP